MTEEKERKHLIPAHILYPGMVVMILGGSVLANVVLIVAAKSDGGAQIESEYYQRAVDWDASQARRAVANELGLSLRVDIGPVVAGNRDIKLSLVDKQGELVEHSDSVLTVSRPSLAKPVAVQPLVASHPAAAQPHSVKLPLERPGLLDFTIEGKIDGREFLVERRREANL